MIEITNNQLTDITGNPSATFVYDGDGNRVQGTVNGVTTVYVNSSYEVSGGVGTSYYFAEGQRIAMRKSGVVSYLLPDHLGSTMVTTNSSGVKTAEQWYKAWGEVRYSSGSLQTKYTYTGQYSNVSDFGLMYYNARFYDPLLSRFSSADSIVPQPGSPQAWDRYSYVLNSPIIHTDPSGHMVDNGCWREGCNDDPLTRTHIIYIGGFPPIEARDAENFSQRAEESFTQNSLPDPSGNISLLNDAFEQGLIYKYLNDPPEVHAFLVFLEDINGNISISSIDIWNFSNMHVSLAKVNISASPKTCLETCISGPLYNYPINPPSIGTQNSGVGITPPHSWGETSLIPSGEHNPNNSFPHKYEISITSTFNSYTPNYDTSSEFRSLVIKLSW